MIDVIYEDFLAQFTDWRPTTLFWQRFSIAEEFGKREIRKVYHEIFKEAKKDYKLLTELVMILNHKTWQHNDSKDSDLSEFYEELYYEAQNYAVNTLKDEELSYFTGITD